MNEKNLQYYLGLKYDVIVREVEDEGETDFKAFTRELNSDAFYGIGATPAEAIESFNEVKEELLPHYLENGLEIPEPQPLDETMPSGKFILRIPPQLHKRLIELAAGQRQSLNNFVTSIIERFITLSVAMSEVRSMLGTKGPTEPDVASSWTLEDEGNITQVTPYTNPMINEASHG